MQLAPATVKPPSVWDRFLRDRGSIPLSLDDFQRFPRHPTMDHPLEMENRQSSIFEQDLLFREATVAGNSLPPVRLQSQSDDIGEIATIQLQSPSVRLGEQLNCAIFFNRDSSKIEIFQMVARLVVTEYCNETASSTATPKEHTISRRVVFTHEELCWLHRQVSFAFNVPTSCPFSFESTDCISVRWSFELTFICGTHPSNKISNSNSNSPLNITPIEEHKSEFKCSIPLTILPNLRMGTS
jgi:hypothetical protein